MTREQHNREFPRDIFDSLVGSIYDFYGVDGTTFCIGIDGTKLVLDAVPDPSDGYRSYFGCFSYESTASSQIFFCAPVAKVRLIEGGRSARIHCFCDGNDPFAESDRPCDTHAQEAREAFKGWVLRDVDTDHEWLTIGTDYGEDYYPCFTFKYSPDPSKKVNIDD